MLKKLPGGTCPDLELYSRRYLDKIRPFRFVVACRTNDLQTYRGEKGLSDEQQQQQSGFNQKQQVYSKFKLCA